MTSFSTPTVSSALTVSAIIPTFNRADLLTQTIHAVLAQTRAPEQIIVIDDGSEDHTKAAISAFADQIKLISKPNTGKADSLNQAIAASTGSHIWIVDDDDIPRTNGLEVLTTLLTANAGADLAYGRHIRFTQDPADGTRSYRKTGYWDMRGPEHFLIATLEDFFVHQPAMLAARALYDRAGPFNTEMIASEDYDMLIRLGRYGKTVASDEIIFEQRVHSGLRGQKGHQFAAAERNRKWIDYDQKIFEAVYRDLPLSAYLPVGTADPHTPEMQRQALSQRACIMARKKLWSLTFTDLQTIATGPYQAELSQTERLILRRALLSKYGCDELFNSPDIMAHLQKFAKSSSLHRALVRAIGRSLLWHSRTELSNRQLRRAYLALSAFMQLY